MSQNQFFFPFSKIAVVSKQTFQVFLADGYIFKMSNRETQGVTFKMNSRDTRTTILMLSAPIPDEEEKVSLNVYFHISLWCLKRFYP